MKMLEIGSKYGRWTVLEFAGRNKSGGSQWNCVCECGTTRVVDDRSLRSGVSKSCGCLAYEHRQALNGSQSRTHGGRNERLYGIWKGIKERCLNPNSKFYDRYGGRGITICDEWMDYAVFREWAKSSGYDESLSRKYCSIDRVDNDKGYYPDNCEWRSAMQQCNNRSSNHILEFNGEVHTISEWSRITGINKSTIWRRIMKYGWSIPRALTEQPSHH